MIEKLNNIWKSKKIYFSQNFKKIYYDIDSQLKHKIDKNKVIAELNNNGFFFVPSHSSENAKAKIAIAGKEAKNIPPIKNEKQMKRFLRLKDKKDL